MEGEEKDKFLLELQSLIVNHPDLITAHNWKIMTQMASQVAPQLVLVKPELYFDPPMPMGTVYYFREELDNCKKNLAELTEWKRLMPYMPTLAMTWVEKKYGPNPTAEQYREAFGPLADFDVHAMRYVALAELGNPEKFMELGKKIAKEDPTMYMDLGTYCVLHDLPDKAVGFFETGIEECPDAVRVSNQSDWLVRYRFEHGQKEKAEELAQSAADVYSARGLLTLAELYERQGKLKEAEDYFDKVKERYRYKYVLLPFYLRNADKDKRYEQEAATLSKSVFPDGMKKVTLASFTDAPKEGMKVTGEDWLAEKSPLKKDVVIVAVNGYAVSTKDQLDVARELTDKPTVWVVYWNGKEYKETSRPVVQGKYLRVDVEALEKPKEAAAGAGDRKAEIDALTKLKDSMMKQAEQLQQQNLSKEQMLRQLMQQNNIPQAVLDKLMEQQGIKPETLQVSPEKQPTQKSPSK